MLATERADRVQGGAGSCLHPRVAVVLGVNARWLVPLLLCRALSIVTPVWWALQCAATLAAELVHHDDGSKLVIELLLAGLWVRIDRS